MKNTYVYNIYIQQHIRENININIHNDILKCFKKMLQFFIQISDPTKLLVLELKRFIIIQHSNAFEIVILGF